VIDPKKLEDVKRVAWAACDTFRGVVDATEYKDYILDFLFLKYISDVWAEHYEEARKTYGENEERIRRRMARERFVLPKGASFNDLHAQRDADNLGELINEALDAIEEANKAKLADVFNVDFNSETKLGPTRDRNRRLKNLIMGFAGLDLSPSVVDEDIIGETYIYLIERFAAGAGKKAGEFYTPLQVSRLMARIMAPKPGDRICDPACGSASMLLRTGEYVEAVHNSRDYALFGQEVNSATYGFARMNMFLHGKDGATIVWGDTLNDPKLIERDALMKFDVVVANPPFSLDQWGAESAGNDRFARFWRGVPPKSKADYAFISHMVEAAKTREGRVGVIVPHGVLFRGGSEGRIRQKLIEENLLDAVIGLPPNLFSTTGIPVAILVFDRAREVGGVHEDRRDVMVIDASRDYREGKRQNALEEAHVAKIVESCQARSVVEHYARPVPIAEIAANNFNLNIPRFIDTAEVEDQIDIQAVEREIETLEAELAELRGKMKVHLRGIGALS
jgi:type I restriction enzyme M protein